MTIFMCGRRQKQREKCAVAYCGRDAVTFCAYEVRVRNSDKVKPCGRFMCEAHSAHLNGRTICDVHAEWLKKKEAERERSNRDEAD